MNKLHELLAVKPTREGEADNLMKKHTASFKSELHLFSRTKKVFFPATEGVDGAKEVVEEDRPLVTSVAKEARFVLDKLTDCVDLNYTIDCANTEAKADIILDNDIPIVKDVPATFLVHLEKRLNQVLKLVEDMATADPAAGYQPDPSEGPNVLKANDVRRARTNKIEKYQVIVPPTVQHPANVVKVTTDEVVGYVTTYNWSTLPTTNQKSDMIARIVKLRDAVVSARARANCHEVEQKKMFGKFVNYILSPIEG